jgi:hypothetical protein
MTASAGVKLGVAQGSQKQEYGNKVTYVWYYVISERIFREIFFQSLLEMTHA